MADGDENEIEDAPDARADAFFARMGTVPASFYLDVEGAQQHAESASADAGAPAWIPLGPRNVGGAVRALAQDPFFPGRWYAGSAQGGLWRTEDDGSTWSPLGSALMMAPVGAIAVSPVSSRFIYVGTGEPHYTGVGGNGLFRSTDGGNTFERLVEANSGTGSARHYGRIQADPLVAQRCWAASNRGLFRFHNSSAVEERFPGVAAGAAVSDVVLAGDPGNADQYLLLAGVAGVGIFRGVYSRDNDRTAWTAVFSPPANGDGTPSIGRIKLAFSKRIVGVVPPTPWAYAVMEDQGFSGAVAPLRGFPTVVFQSTDLGVTWPARPAVGLLSAATSADPPVVGRRGIAWYALAIAVDPGNPRRVIVGHVSLFASIDGARTFSPAPLAPPGPILDWTRYDNGDRAQHGDQHAIVFDLRNSNHLWAGNDGGVSFTPNLSSFGGPPPGGVWQKRSYGIMAAQLNDLTTHPNFPFIYGGGLQDNGTFVSFGGPTWYRLLGGDGGQIAFVPSAAAVPPVFARSFFASTQNNVHAVSVASVPGAMNSTTLPDIDPPGNVMTPSVTGTLALPAVNAPPFIGIVEGDGRTANRLLLGRDNTTPVAGAVAGFYSTDGATVAQLTTPGLTGNVMTVKFAPNPPDVWLGTSTGMLFTTIIALPAPPGVGAAWTARPLPGAPVNAISSIAVHRTSNRVVAVSTMGSPGAVFLSHDSGANWLDVSGTGGKRLPPGAILCVEFHPTDTGVLFAGTFAGVYVIRNLPAPGGAPAVVPAFTPEWKTYNNALPLVQVNDLTLTPLTLTLRCATFGRGAFECNVDGGTPAAMRIPEVMLSIRDHVTDDGRAYPPANVFFDDPRLPAPGVVPPGFDITRAFDIRIDAPSFRPVLGQVLPAGISAPEGSRFGSPLDGSEVDETLVSDVPLVGDINFVYVQVHNRGSSVANDVGIHLYFAEARPGPNAGDPPVIPPIAAGFNFPQEPTAVSDWQRAALPQTVQIQPGQPHVARFAWVPPLRLQTGVALLAVCSNTADPLAAGVPAGAVEAFVRADRRAALRFTLVRRDAVTIRDGVDDTGTVGSVAWGGRSPDIVVRQVAVAAPDDPVGELGDLRDTHLSDRVRPGANIIYVRVWNRTLLPLDARVQVFQVPNPNVPSPGTAWTPLGPPVDVLVIPANGFRFARIDWAVVDPDPANAYKAFALFAVASVLDPAGVELDPFPDRNTAIDVPSFWRFALNAPLANNTALRALRFETP